MSKEIKPCPFCGSENIDYSIKTTNGGYHMSMYCKECHCYGARVLIKHFENGRFLIERNETYKELAIKEWNTRKPIDKVIEQLEESYSCDVGALQMISLDTAIEIVKGGAK